MNVSTIAHAKTNNNNEKDLFPISFIRTELFLFAMTP